VNCVYTLLLAATLVLIQCLIGGPLLAYSFPPYAIAGVAAALSLVSLRRPVPKPSLWCLGSTLLFAGYVFARAWVSPHAQLARTDAYMVAACLIVYLLTALHLTESRHRNWVVAALFAMAAVHVGVGLLQFKEGQGFMLFGFHRGTTYEYRGSGQLFCPNHLAGYLETLILFALSLTFWSRCQVATKMLTAYLALFCLMGMAITGSRGGYLSLMFGLLVFVGLSLWVVRIYKAGRFALTLLITVVALVLFLGSTVGIMMNSKVIRERLHRIGTASEDVRWYNWLAAIDQFKLSPVLGTGSGTHLYYGRLFRRQQIQTDPQHVHGDYLELLAEYGLVGGALGALFLFTHLSGGLSAVRQVTLRRLCNTFDTARSDTLALSLGAVTAVAALMAHSVVDFNMHIPGNALVFAFIFGMLANPGTDPVVKGRARVPLLVARIALVAMGIALLVSIATRYQSENLTNQARIAMKAGEYDECMRLAKLALERDPTNADASFYLGEAYRATGANMPSYPVRQHYFEQAIDAYRKGLAYFPENENLWVRMGQCLDGIYEFGEAEEAYLSAIKTDPNLGILYAYYAAHLRLAGDTEGAKACDNAARSLGAQGTQGISMEEPSFLFIEKQKENDETSQKTIEPSKGTD